MHVTSDSAINGSTCCGDFATFGAINSITRIGRILPEPQFCCVMPLPSLAPVKSISHLEWTSSPRLLNYTCGQVIVDSPSRKAGLRTMMGRRPTLRVGGLSAGNLVQKGQPGG